MNSEILLVSLQTFLDRRGVDPAGLTPDQMVEEMLAWFRGEPLGRSAVQGDTLVFRYGGWSEGCATGFKLSLLRRVTVGTAPDQLSWMAGVTLMFDPARFARVAPYTTVASDWKSLESFVGAIRSSRAFIMAAAGAGMGGLLEVGGLR